MTFVQFIYTFAITFFQIVAPLSFGVFLAVLFALKVWSRGPKAQQQSVPEQRQAESRSARLYARD